MSYIPYTVMKSIHEQTHLVYPDAPDAPLLPVRPRRHPFRAIRRFMQRSAVSEQSAVSRPAAESRPALTVVRAGPDELCEAELRDRGTTSEGVARAS